MTGKRQLVSVLFNGNIKRFIQFGEAFKRDIYISVKIQDGKEGKSPKNDLSGKYSYVSNKNNADTFVREEFVPSLEKTQFVLLYRNGFWFITNEEYYLGKKKNNEIEGYVRLETKGKVKIIPQIYWHLSSIMLYFQN